MLFKLWEIILKGSIIWWIIFLNFFYKPCILSCPNCGNDILVNDLSKHMGISGVEGCEWIVYKYDFLNDVIVECSKCNNKFKVIGSVYDGPDEGYVSHYLRLTSLQDQKNDE